MKRYSIPAIVAALAILVSPACADNNHAETNSPQFIRTSNGAPTDTDFTVAAENTVNAVVCIKSYTNQRQQQQQGYPGGGFNDPFFEFFFGPQQRQQQPRQQQRNSEPVQSGLGSGVILSEDGYIVTNNHVIADADKLEVLLNDNSTYEAEVIGTDEATDLALIKIDAENLHSITFGNSDDLKIGEWVLAVGNPFGFNSTVTAGIVSAKARSISQNARGGKMGIESFIQTDAALNPGNSGGALVNLKGELVGINSAIYSNTGSYAGFSFAIPTSIVKKVMTDIRQYGTVQRAMLGCTIVELDAKLAKEKKITATKNGVMVGSVTENTTAEEIGLQPDDVIIAINGVTTATVPQLLEQLNQYRPGDEITVTFIRNNEKMEKSGVLRNSHGNTNLTKKGDFSELGCAFVKMSDEAKRRLRIRNGVKVTGVKEGGAFREAGVKDSFIILDINGRMVNNAADVENIYNQIMKSDDEDKVMFITGIYPSGKKYYYAVNLASE